MPANYAGPPPEQSIANEHGGYISDPASRGDYGANQRFADDQRNTNRADRPVQPLSRLSEPSNRESSDITGLFAKPPQKLRQAGPSIEKDPKPVADNPYPEYHQQYWPPPVNALASTPAGSSGLVAPEPVSVSRLSSTASASTVKAQRGSPPPSRDLPAGAAGDTLAAPQPSKINRLNSSASTNTTRAERGSPPPPETPITPVGGLPGGDIEARYAAAGIAGTATLNSLQAHNAAAAQRAGQYPQQAGRLGPSPNPQTQNPQRRPWTPTEQPGSQPFGPPTIYQGPAEVTGSPPPQPFTQNVMSPPTGRNDPPAQTGLEEDIQRTHLSSSPPPAYSSVPQGMGASHGYPNEKQRPAAATTAAPPVPVSSPAPSQAQHDGHPAFANEPRPSPVPQAGQETHAPIPQIAGTQTETAGHPPASPPPLPEGWIAHLDQNSGQYYYIHLPTQATQWEFPKGPTPLNINEPLSPAVSTYGNNPLASPGLSVYSGKPLASPGFASPGFPPATPGYAESVMSMGGASSVVTGFTGPPPSSGVEMYKVAPTNGVYFGPYLRYTNMDLERGLWLGSILLVTDAPQPPTIHIHQTVDLSPNRQLTSAFLSVLGKWLTDQKLVN